MTPAPSEAIRRLVYLGTPDVAVEPLVALNEAGFDIALVITRPDARRGRGGQRLPSPVKAAAIELGLTVADDINLLATVEADLAVVVAYGRILQADVLRRLHFVNLHFSLLPRWRGAAPVERAILAGDQRTGVCLMAIEQELDTGAVYRRVEVAIDPDEMLDELRGRLVSIGAKQLVTALREGLGEAVPQMGEPSYAAKITAADREIDWSAPAVAIHRQVRVGGAFTSFRGRRFKIHRSELVTDGADRLKPGEIALNAVGSGEGALRLLEVQPAGRSRTPAPAWLNGARPSPSERFGQ